MLSQTEYIRAKLDKYGYELSIYPTGRAAHSSRAQRFIGDNWLALGDAAISFDPLSSQGIVTAIDSAEIAASEIISILKRTKIKSQLYSEFIDNKYQTYLKEHQYYYSQEKRWLDAPFWEKYNTIHSELVFS